MGCNVKRLYSKHCIKKLVDIIITHVHLIIVLLIGGYYAV